MVSFAWIFFRASSFSDALYVISNMFNGVKGLQAKFFLMHDGIQLTILLSVMALYVLSATTMASDKVRTIFNANILFRYGVYYLLAIVLLLFHVSGKSEFIYFKF